MRDVALAPFYRIMVLGALVLYGAVPAVIAVVTWRLLDRCRKLPPNLIRCPDCDQGVSRLAETCPHCGRPLLRQPAA